MNSIAFIVCCLAGCVFATTNYPVGLLMIESEAPSALPLVEAAVATINNQNLLGDGDTLALNLLPFAPNCSVAAGSASSSDIATLPSNTLALLLHTCTDHSQGAAPVALAAGLPVIASRATASFFSSYPQFARTCHDGRTAITGLQTFFQTNQWDTFSIVMNNDSYSQDLYNTTIMMYPDADVFVAQNAAFDVPLLALNATHQRRLVVCLVYSQYAQTLAKSIADIAPLATRFQFVFPTLLGEENDQMWNGQSVAADVDRVRVALHGSLGTDIDVVDSSATITARYSTPLLNTFRSMVTSLNNNNNSTSINPYAMYAFDAVGVLAQAIINLKKKQNNSVPATASTIFPLVSTVAMIGASGEIDMLASTRSMPSLLLNVVGPFVRTIGVSSEAQYTMMRPAIWACPAYPQTASVTGTTCPRISTTVFRIAVSSWDPDSLLPSLENLLQSQLQNISLNVQVVPFTDPCDSSLAAGFAAQLLQAKIMAVLGASCTATMQVVAPILGQYDIPIVETDATANSTLSLSSAVPNFYRCTATNQALEPVLIQLLINYGWKRIGLVFEPADSFSADMANVVQQATQQVGVSLELMAPVSTTQDTTSQASLTAALYTIQQLEIPVVIYVLVNPQNPLIAATMKNHVAVIPFIVTDVTPLATTNNVQFLAFSIPNQMELMADATSFLTTAISSVQTSNNQIVTSSTLNTALREQSIVGQLGPLYFPPGSNNRYFQQVGFAFFIDPPPAPALLLLSDTTNATQWTTMGSVAPVSCPRGSFATLANSRFAYECQPCPMGQSQSLVNQLQCSTCSACGIGSPGTAPPSVAFECSRYEITAPTSAELSLGFLAALSAAAFVCLGITIAYFLSKYFAESVKENLDKLFEMLDWFSKSHYVPAGYPLIRHSKRKGGWITLMMCVFILIAWGYIIASVAQNPPVIQDVPTANQLAQSFPVDGPAPFQFVVTASGLDGELSQSCLGFQLDSPSNYNFSRVNVTGETQQGPRSCNFTFSLTVDTSDSLAFLLTLPNTRVRQWSWYWTALGSVPDYNLPFDQGSVSSPAAGVFAGNKPTTVVHQLQPVQFTRFLNNTPPWLGYNPYLVQATHGSILNSDSFFSTTGAQFEWIINRQATVVALQEVTDYEYLTVLAQLVSVSHVVWIVAGIVLSLYELGLEVRDKRYHRQKAHIESYKIFFDDHDMFTSQLAATGITEKVVDVGISSGVGAHVDMERQPPDVVVDVHVKPHYLQKSSSAPKEKRVTGFSILDLVKPRSMPRGNAVAPAPGSNRGRLKSVRSATDILDPHRARESGSTVAKSNSFSPNSMTVRVDVDPDVTRAHFSECVAYADDPRKPEAPPDGDMSHEMEILVSKTMTAKELASVEQ